MPVFLPVTGRVTVMAAASKRDQLIDTALRLFGRDGYHATGIDRILAEAGVARMTLYNQFGSKEELIIAALRRRDADFRTWLRDAVDARAGVPRQRLLALFDVLDAWFKAEATAPPFFGCTFINAAAEFSDPDDPVHRQAADHKARVCAYVTELAAAAGAADPEMLARDLLLLMDGAMVGAQVTGDQDAALRARALAATVLYRRLGTDPSESTHVA